LKDSFRHNTVGVAVLEKILSLNEKVKEEFQKAKGYEAMIDYLHTRSISPETKSLNAQIVSKVFSILEEATLNDYVRGQLSEKKKIKDLFVSVLKALDLQENTALFGTLISFGSNLCFGKHETKFRELLKKDFGDLMNIIVNMVTFVIEKTQEDMKEQEEIKLIKSQKLKKKEKKRLAEREAIQKQKVKDLILLKQVLCGFISNLALEPSFRKFFAAEEFLEYIVSLLRIEEDRKNFDWIGSSERILAVLINCSLATSAQEYLGKAGVFELIEKFSVKAFYSEEYKDLIVRLMYLLSRLVSQPEVILKIVSSKTMMIRLFLYFNRQFPDLTPHVLKILYAVFKLKDKLADLIKEHEININNFVKESREMTQEYMDTWNREKFINLAGLVSAFLDCFPNTASEYTSLIQDLTAIIKDKVDLERKNAAVLVAKLAKDETCKEAMRQNHTMQILMSLGDNVLKT